MKDAGRIKVVIVVVACLLSLLVLSAALRWMRPAGYVHLDKARAAEKNTGTEIDAIREYTLAIESGDLSQISLAQAYYGRGNLYYLRDWDRCIADFTKAIELNERWDLAYCLRGDAHEEKGDLDKAIADYTRAIELDAEYVVLAYNSRGMAYLDKGDPDKAIADFTRSIELKPQSEAAYNYRGRAYRKKGQDAKADADFRKVKELRWEQDELRWEQDQP